MVSTKKIIIIINETKYTKMKLVQEGNQATVMIFEFLMRQNMLKLTQEEN
jgi:hypothetical protein